jgi:alkylation response protein AidB-like acyl-CoA dehydrogenase
MEFGLSDDQEVLQRSAREFLAAECPPAVVRQAAENADGVSRALEQKLAEMGWTGVLVPTAHGGLGLSVFEAVLLAIEIGRHAAPGPFLFSSILATAAIIAAGNRAQKKRWLPHLASGERTATVALFEEDDRLDPAGVRCGARRFGSSHRLRGRKLFVPYAASADWIVVAARSSGKDGEAGVSLFLVDRDAPGLSIEPLASFDRTRRFYELTFRDVDVPADQALGPIGAAWSTIARLHDFGALVLAADGLGGSERVLEMAVAYSKTREQFGRAIGSFQAIKHIAAEMVADIEPARSLVWYAGYAQDASVREAARAASMAKASLSEIYARSANRAVQMHGGIGFTWEHDIHFWFKRAKWNELAFGDAAYHRERVAALGRF